MVGSARVGRQEEHPGCGGIRRGGKIPIPEIRFLTVPTKERQPVHVTRMLLFSHLLPSRKMAGAISAPSLSEVRLPPVRAGTSSE